MYKSSYVLPDLFQFIGCIRNVRIWSFFNVQFYNALFNFLFVMLRKLTSASLRRLFTNKIDVFPFYKSGFYLPTGGGGGGGESFPPNVSASSQSFP